MTSTTIVPQKSPVGARQRARSGGGIQGRQWVPGWTFSAPMLVILAVFLVAPILLALWVSFSDWSGKGSPLAGGVGFVGFDNYSKLLTKPGLTQRDFMTSIHNNLYYVAIVVPAQTALALGLALILNLKLRARGFFRSAFYFPSVTSSVAISLVFLFLFTGGGAVNSVLGFFGIKGPTWFSDARGLIHLTGGGLGIWNPDSPPTGLTGHSLLGLSLWEWISGPSVAMCVIIILVVWTTSGTFMLMFLAGLQGIPKDVEEAAKIDGASSWQRFRYITLPFLRPTMFLVTTLGLIGTWQVFDQVYVMSKGAPAKTTLTPAYLSYSYAFNQGQWGVAAAMAFVLFAIIVAFTLVQRFLLRDKDAGRDRRQIKSAKRTRVAEAQAKVTQISGSGS